MKTERYFSKQRILAEPKLAKFWTDQPTNSDDGSDLDRAISQSYPTLEMFVRDALPGEPMFAGIGKPMLDAKGERLDGMSAKDDVGLAAGLARLAAECDVKIVTVLDRELGLRFSEFAAKVAP